MAEEEYGDDGGDYEQVEADGGDGDDYGGGAEAENDDGGDGYVEEAPPAEEEEEEEAGGGGDDYKAPEVVKEAPVYESSGPVGDYESLEDAWLEICKDENKINWYMASVDGKQNLGFFKAGNGGLHELSELLKTSQTEPYFGLLRVNSTDKGGSVRAKFIYIRFVGTKVKMMRKARLTPNLGKFGDAFPVKHLTIDLTEALSAFTVEKLAKEFLRVGGAHKPDSYVFGPGQVFKVN